MHPMKNCQFFAKSDHILLTLSVGGAVAYGSDFRRQALSLCKKTGSV
jgi:hypothetical protein